MATFTVDNNASDAKCAEMIEALRRTVKYGKMAEKALRNIRENGFHDGKVPCAHAHPYGMEVHRFPKRVAVDRSMIPEWKSLSVACGEIRETRVCGRPIKTLSVYLVGIGLRPDFADAKTVHVRKIAHGPGRPHSKIGDARLKKSGEITLDTRHGVMRIRRSSGAYEGAMRDAARFAALTAQILVGTEDLSPYCRGRCPAQLLDLEAQIKAWLIEDGIANRMANDIFDAAEVAKIMSA